MTTPVATAVVERFRAALLALTRTPPATLGVAVSGGPDSLALLLLAATAFPGRVEAATVDHGLRPESSDEAAVVAELCAQRHVPHAILRLEWPDPPGGNLQARAREGRYAELGQWACRRGLSHLATAHHADDQAETVLMRLARGAGLAGLAGARRERRWIVNTDRGAETRLVRPLLGWRRAALAQIVAAAGVSAVDDPSNHDERFDRTRARALLAAAPWLDPLRVSASAQHLLECDKALDWVIDAFLHDRTTVDVNGAIVVHPDNLPAELQRRVLLRAMSHFGGCAPPPSGPKLMRVLALLRAGRRCTLAGVQLTGGDTWHLTWAPPRRGVPR